MVLREVVSLDDPAGPASGPVGSIELQDPSQPAVATDGLHHCLVFLRRGFSEGLPELQDAPGLQRDVLLQRCGDSLLCDAVHLHALLREPGLQLHNAVGILQPGEPGRFLCQLLRPDRVIFQDPFDIWDIQKHAVIIGPLIPAPEPLFIRIHWPIGVELLEDLLLRHDVLGIVLNKELPLLRRVFRQVPGAAAVGLCGPAWFREVLDQRLAGAELLLVLIETQGGAYACQVHRQAQHRRSNHRALPLLRLHIAEVLGEAGPLEVGIEGRFQHITVVQGRV